MGMDFETSGQHIQHLFPYPLNIQLCVCMCACVFIKDKNDKVGTACLKAPFLISHASFFSWLPPDINIWRS